MDPKKKIADLSQKLSEMEYHARGREYTRDEVVTMAEMEGAIAAIKKELPVGGGPLSRPGSHLAAGQRVITDHGTGIYKSFGEQAQSIARASAPGGEVDPRLHQVRAAATGLSESVPSDGGFLVQSDFSNSLLQGVNEISLVANRVNRIPISPGSNSIKLPMVDETSRVDGSRWGGIQSFWTAEADEKIKSKPKFRKIELELKKLIGLSYATDELLQDSAALDAFLRQAFIEEIAFKVDDAIINGTGAGMPLGVLTSGALVSVDKEVGQNAATIVFENIVRMFSRMPARNRKNACWFISQSVETQLFTMSLSVGTGGIPVYMPAGGASAAPYASLFGRPVIPIEQCPALGTLGDIIFMDPTAYVLIDKGGVQTDVSIHVSFIYDQSVFRFVYRVDGQPSWAAPLTPFKGSATLSPFIALAARA